MTATFVAPGELGDVLSALAAGAVPLAGGTDLVVGHRQGKRLLPQALVSLDALDALRGIEQDDTTITIGALTSHDHLRHDDLVRSHLTALADASSIVGSEATRSTGTIGGNVMNASPAADTVGPLLCLGATAVLTRAGADAAETRRVALDELFVGPGRTMAEPSELLVAVEIPRPALGTGSAYVRLEYRRHMEIAVVGAAAVVSLDPAGSIVDARIAVTAVAPTVRRVPEAEQVLIGALPDRAAADAAGAAAAASATPISDVRASAEYRSAMIAVITRRAILVAAARARGEDVRIPASDSTFGADR